MNSFWIRSLCFTYFFEKNLFLSLQIDVVGLSSESPVAASVPVIRNPVQLLQEQFQASPAGIFQPQIRDEDRTEMIARETSQTQPGPLFQNPSSINTQPYTVHTPQFRTHDGFEIRTSHQQPTFSPFAAQPVEQPQPPSAFSIMPPHPVMQASGHPAFSAFASMQPPQHPTFSVHPGMQAPAYPGYSAFPSMQPPQHPTFSSHPGMQAPGPSFAPPNFMFRYQPNVQIPNRLLEPGNFDQNINLPYTSLRYQFRQSDENDVSLDDQQ